MKKNVRSETKDFYTKYIDGTIARKTSVGVNEFFRKSKETLNHIQIFKKKKDAASLEESTCSC